MDYATDDWRTTSQRQIIVNRIMETLKIHHKSSGPDELSKIATTFEEKMYMASTSESDYLRKISMKMLTMGIKSQTTGMANTIQSNSGNSTENPPDSASIDSMAQRGHSAVDWQEEVYQKIQSMKEKYLPGLNDMYQKITIKCQQHDSVLNVPKSDQIERLKLFRNMLQRTIQFLNVPKNKIVPGVKDKLAAYEKQIIGILNSNMPRKPVSAQQQLQQPGGHLLSMQPQQQQVQQQQVQQQQQLSDNHMNHQMQPTDMQNSVSSKQSTAVASTHHGVMPLLSNHNMEVTSTETIQSISNNIYQLQHLEHQKQQLKQQFEECQVYQQWINQQMQHVLQQQQQLLQEQQQQQIPPLQQQFQQLALQQQSVQLQAANKMSQLSQLNGGAFNFPTTTTPQQQSSSSSAPQIHDQQQQQ